jgi:hypothetical protein
VVVAGVYVRVGSSLYGCDSVWLGIWIGR